MATSGTSTYSLNARDIITLALSKVLVQEDQDFRAADIATGLMNLNVMLKGWQLTGPNLWRQTEASLTLTAATQSYALSTKPYSISSARYRSATGIDLPMELLTRQEYFDMPLKSATGVSTQYYFDRQRDSGTLYVWPVLASVTTETIVYTYQRRFEDITALTEDVDIPQEYLNTVSYSLAELLCDDFSSDDRTAAKLARTAGMMRAAAAASDREPEYRFIPGRR
jgi:hypothetical protein